MTAKVFRRILWLIAGAAVLLMVAGTGLSLIHMFQNRTLQPLFSHQGLLQFSTLLYAVFGAVILMRQPGNRIAWIFLATGFLTGLMSFSVGYSVFIPFTDQNGLPSIDWTLWLNRWIWLPSSYLPTIMVFQLFPAGRLPGPRWSLVGWTGALGMMLASLAIALHPGSLESWDIVGQNPYGIEGTEAFMESLLNLSMVPLTIGVASAFWILVQRFRRAGRVERQQMKWLLYALAMTGLGGVLSGLAPHLFPMSREVVEEAGLVITSLSIIVIAAAVGIAVLRYRLYDIDLFINRTLVYSGLTSLVVFIYVIVVSGLGFLLRSNDSLGVSLLGVGAVALIVQPARERFQRAVNRLMFGDRDDPYEALSRLNRRLARFMTPDDVLPEIVETVAETLRLPYVAISLKLSEADSSADAILAAHGEPGPDPLVLPLVYQAETVGHLVVITGPGESFSTADMRLLEDLSRQIGVAIHAARLTTELQRSRQRIVTAREEERRRLRRDLHDGLGSQLAALHLRLDTLRSLLPESAKEAVNLTVELREEVHAAIGDIRRLVYSLRPPALDELGLSGALQSLAAQASSRDRVQILVEAPDTRLRLPAAVEVAVYRIAQEAVTNVVRHANARFCQIRLSLGKELCIEIADDGDGLPVKLEAGVGLRSMRARATELGGTFDLAQAAGKGVLIRARFPLQPEPHNADV